MQVRGSDDTLQFADKFRNYSKEDGHAYKKMNNKNSFLEEKVNYIVQIVKQK